MPRLPKEGRRRMKSVSFFVEGTPKGQPRVKAFSRGGRAGVYTPDTADGWKSCVRAAWLRTDRQRFPGAVSLIIHFYFQRPASHFGAGKNKAVLNSRAPLHHKQPCDIDNAVKGVMDVLTRCGAWIDDCHVVSLHSSKQWAVGIPAGCQIQIHDLTETNPQQPAQIPCST